MFKTFGALVRSPFFPISYLLSNRFEEVISSKFFLEALYLASPLLHEQYVKNINQPIPPSQRASLYKYFVRMSYRSTPFGTFAGVNFAKVGNTTEIEFVDNKSYCKHTKLDNHLLNAFVDKLLADPLVQREVIWKPNNTIIRKHNELRFIEWRTTNGVRSYHLSRVQNNDSLEAILSLASNGATSNQLISLLETSGIEQTEAAEFIQEVIENKLLLSDIDIAITADDPAQSLIRSLEKYESCKKNSATLRSIIYQLKTLDDQGPGTSVEDYKKAVEALNDLNVTDLRFTFQCDLRKPTIKATISEFVLEEIKQAIYFLAAIKNKGNSTNITRFKEAFVKRYEEQEVSILEVLDSESGIGYPPSQYSFNDNTPLLDGLTSLNTDTFVEYKLHPWQIRLLQAYESATRNNLKEIVINPNDLGIRMDDVKPSDFPISFYSMVQILIKRGQTTNYIIDYIGSDGPSALNLLGRFGQVDDQIAQLSKECADKERDLLRDALLAEIVHVPGSRIGNVISRPAFRDYEIPILATASVPASNVIPLTDIYVSVRNNRIILRSKQFKKEIIPRNSNAHSYHRETIPYYHFLCDVQFDNSASKLTWDWGILNNFTFLPRVKFGNTILAKARWVINKETIRFNTANSKKENQNLIKDWCLKNQIPPTIVLVEGDNKLLLNLNDEFAIPIICNALVKMGKVILEESYLENHDVIACGPEGPYASELIIPWVQDNNPLEKQSVKLSSLNEFEIDRSFICGSEWFYIKLYCGVKVADTLIKEVIYPLAIEFEQNRDIEKWFYIRYGDPEHHLRVRFKGKGEFYVKVLKSINELLKPYLKYGLVNKVIIDSYQREIERYGSLNIDHSETLFWIDSIYCAKLLYVLEGDLGDELRWKVACKGIDDLMSCFEMTSLQKFDLMKYLSDGYGKEQSNDLKTFKQDLSIKFRAYRMDLELMLSDREIDGANESTTSILIERMNRIRPIAEKVIKYLHGQEVQVKFDGVVASYIHMFVNRLLRSKQRLHEAILYDLLAQHYRSYLAKAKK